MQTQLMASVPRITLISALAQSLAPATAAMEQLWPEALVNNLLDDSLARDLAELGEITRTVFERFSTLGRYAAEAGGAASPTAGIMFTCSAFGPAIDRVKEQLQIPVISPNEGAFDEALDLCRDKAGAGRVGLLLSFAGSLKPLSDELRAMAVSRGQSPPEIIGAVADGALAALQAADVEAHDRLIAKAAATLPPTDTTVIGQFSMARVEHLVAARRSEPVLTTPHAAVRKLRRMVEAHTQPNTNERRSA
jgi:Asp/Glu/hydantoin racemase